ncbi:hypothetical protein CcaverHIS002_0304390 [Cutaneotrichosporon cavernicola]|uniref:GPI mannosyltransferase 1 n=1 Tax=Cutaneotrichosporon cavernicola TaxID=279322 RepID=A0AA48L0U3_9TREE|nr:uncharacterized protein CcaverHIS019_0304360 [Cutaneotrichosporon cavernicola]BEI82571.1 hypothetical protein CcaverHIS002_0304390 [Cutaneotrichosporon cavernicola]BEI90366.1 hypothetical protein CcaverHIS019_0304360 [Cutaneotrichosporon cavernicola]BEI98142.1 hypothetical protein CcaverHIS631_0304410 [Cutaneotrichosporon cavernicola]BEJ05919.1 hypothetical protein CcaverHIS641_0304410 [Cutaneotrichosporon cavernicola]
MGWSKYTAPIIALSAAIQVALVAYAAYVDAHPDRFGGLKYTDVDWRVVLDGLHATFSPKPYQIAEGPLGPSLSIGSPYHRATFRYTPLLVLVLSPAAIAPVLGRLVLVGLTLAVPPVLLAAGAVESKVHALWTLNPVVLNISTRGSPEALPCLLTAALALTLRRAGLGRRGSSSHRGKWEAAAAVILALATSYKIYPVIYVAAIWSALARVYGWLGAGVWRFGFITASTALVINGALWLVWGQPFLEHTFLYHLSRLDHRHNFSPYFLPIYFARTMSDEGGTLLHALRNPLASFLPQVSLVLGAGFVLTPRLGVESAMFFQTALFVVFNKVCTSQYFLWPLPLVPLLTFPSLTWTRLAAALAAWIAGQALWLSQAYRLELLGESVWVRVWAAGLVLFAASVWGLGLLLEGTREPTSLAEFNPVTKPPGTVETGARTEKAK